MVHEYDAHACDICKKQVIVNHGESTDLMKPFEPEFEKRVEGLPSGSSYPAAEICEYCIQRIVDYISSIMVIKR